jgi:putative flippase GtrA
MNLLAEQFCKFTGVGAIGTAAHYVTLITLVQLTGTNAVLASSVGAIVGALVNYHLNYHFTFRSNKAHHDAIVKFFLVAGVGFIFNAVLMALLTEYLQLHYLLSQVITTGIVLVWNFTGNRLWTFRKKPHELEE